MYANIFVSSGLIFKQKNWSGGIALKKLWLNFGMLGRLSSKDINIFRPVAVYSNGVGEASGKPEVEKFGIFEDF